MNDNRKWERLYELCQKWQDQLQDAIDIMNIAEPKEGSAEWAKEMLKSGKRVCNPKYQIGDWYLIRRVPKGISTDYPYMSMGINSSNMKLADNVFDNMPDGWQLYDTEMMFENVKENNWVEIEDGRHIQVICSCDRQFQCAFPSGSFQWFDKSDGGYSYVQGLHHRAVRIVPPYEVIVDFGAFKGTVHHSTTSADHVVVENDKYEIIAKCNISALDTATAEQVKALLKAQEEK